MKEFSNTISIITVSYNPGLQLTNCINSIKSQTVPIEHILIDGASTDESLEIIESNRDHFYRIVSEKDEGIYDAMNKGLELANGDIVGILNTDDHYIDKHVIEKVLSVFENPEVMGCYGDLVYFDKKDETKIVRTWISGEYSERKFYWGWMPPHPTFFVRKSVYESYGNFNTHLGSAADYELMLRFMLRHQINVAYLPEILVRMSTGGTSNSSIWNRIRANRMDKKAWYLNNLRPNLWTLLAKPFRKLGQWLN